MIITQNQLGVKLWWESSVDDVYQALQSSHFARALIGVLKCQDWSLYTVVQRVGTWMIGQSQGLALDTHTRQCKSSNSHIYQKFTENEGCCDLKQNKLILCLILVFTEAILGQYIAC